MAIIDKYKNNSIFTFSHVTKEEVSKEIGNLDTTKSYQDIDIPTKIIKQNSDIFASFICKTFNNMVNSSTFPAALKLTHITPAFKNGSKNSKENYRPISILPNVSKIYERCMYKQMSDYLEIFFSKFQCGFRQGISAQHCLLAMIEKWKKCVDQGKTFGALLIDLSKAFDCLPHDLIIAKLNAYGFSLSASKLIRNYLSHRKQRTKINSSYSSWEEILSGTPQGSMLGTLLFNIFVSDLFSVLNDVEFASYADDNTPYVVKNNIKGVIKSLENSSVELFDWLPDNQMKANPDKCHFITSESKDLVINAENNQITNSKCEKLLLSNYWKRIVQSLYIQRIFVFLQLNCLKLLRVLHRQSLMIYSL